MANPKKILSITAIIAGGLFSVIGILLVGMYILKAVIERIGEGDQSLLFWYLPILFIGLLGIKFGVIMVL